MCSILDLGQLLFAIYTESLANITVLPRCVECSSWKTLEVEPIQEAGKMRLRHIWEGNRLIAGLAESALEGGLEVGRA